MDGDITSADIEAAMSGDGGGATSDPAPDATAATQPAGTDAGAALAGHPADPSQGEPPADKWPTILDNARRKAAEEAWKGYEPLRGVKPEQVNDLISWWQRAQKNPDDFLTNTVLEHADPMALIERIVQQVQSHPQHSAALRRFVGQKMAAMRGSQPQAAPQYLIPQPDGSVVVDLAAKEKWEAWHEQSILSKFQAELAPIKQRMQAEDDRAKAAEQSQAMDRWADTNRQDFLTWPEMTDEATRQEVIADFWEKVEHRELNQDQLERELAAAHRRVVFPKMGQRAHTQALQNINRTASAGTVNPARTSTGAPKSVDQMSLREAIEAALAG